jgi:membrane protein YqaA with SNARE-associated domain
LRVSPDISRPDPDVHESRNTDAAEMSLGDLALALACVFGVNLLPAFGPPTWAVLVFFELNGDLAAVPLVIGGAIAAACGRLTLAWASGRCRGRLSERRLQNLTAARDVLTGDRRKALGGLALFALSPVPSAQLFVAAGLLAVPLVPLALAFFAGRLVSYSIYMGGATLAQESLGDAFAGALTSPVGIALQLAMLAALVGLVKLDWAAIATRRLRAGRP